MKKISITLLTATVFIFCLILSCKKETTTTQNTGTCSDGIKNQDEASVDCGGVCSVCQTCSDGIKNQGEDGVDCGGPCAKCPGIYPANGAFGPNFIRNDTITVFSSGTPPNTVNEKYYSMAAQLPLGASIKVVMHYTPNAGSPVGGFSNGWALVFGTSNGWLTTAYESNTQQFTATGQANCDIRMEFLNHGIGVIDIYENGATTPTRSKTLSW